MIRAALLACVLGAVLLTGCSGADRTPAPDEPAGPAALDPERALAVIEDDAAIVIDVRTPEEYAGGHLSGAINVDALAPDFEERIARIEPTYEYLVYCTTGNRSADAVAVMREAGLQVVDAGGLVDLQRAGASLVKGPDPSVP